MNALLGTAVLLLVGIAGLGFCWVWLHLSTNSKDQNPIATITVDKDKLRVDENKAKETVRRLG